MKRFLFCLLILSYHVSAQTNELKQLVQKSFEYHPRIAELVQQTIIQEERVAVQETNRYPTLNATAGYNYINPVGQTTFSIPQIGLSQELKFQPNNNYNVALAANYVLFDFGRVGSAIKKSKAEVVLANQNTAQAKTQLAAQLASVYYGVVYLKQAIAVEDSILKSLRENKKTIESKFKNGDALELDVLTINSNIDAEDNKKVELQTQLQKQYSLLEYATGIRNISEQTNFNFTGVRTNTSKENSFLAVAENQNIDFQIAKQRIEIAKLDWNNAKRNFYPTINLQANAGYRNGYQPDINQLRFNYLAGVNISAPIFQGFKLKHQRELFNAQLKLNEIYTKTLQQNYLRDERNILSDIEAYNVRIQNAQSQIAQAKRALAISTSRYKNGVATQIEYLNALNTLQRIQLSALNFEYQKCLSSIELNKLVGITWWNMN